VIASKRGNRKGSGLSLRSGFSLVTGLSGEPDPAIAIVAPRHRIAGRMRLREQEAGVVISDSIARDVAGVKSG
jgi:hypothetical protein